MIHSPLLFFVTIFSPPEPAGPPSIGRPAGGAGVPCEGRALPQGGVVQRGNYHRGLP